MATKAEESGIWQRIDKATTYRAMPIGDLNTETVVMDAIQASRNAIAAITWKGGYPNPGNSVSGIEPALRTALNLGDDRRPHLVRIEGDSVHPMLPTDYGLEAIDDIPGFWLEGWILALTGRIEGGPALVNYGEMLGSAPVWNAYLSASAYLATKGTFVPISDRKRLQAATEKVDAAVNNAEDTDRRLTKRLREFESETSTQNQRLEAVVSRAEAFADYKQLYEYFGDKAWWHRLNFGFFLVVFFASAALLAGLVWGYRSEITPFLPKIGNEGIELGGTLVVIAPALVAIWFLRVFLRLSMLNLRLKEDAQNRQVLIQTLAALEDDDSNKITEQERVVAYSAIFRSSLADQGDLDISNPTIADIAGMFKKG